jgi:hypothetical protein
MNGKGRLGLVIFIWICDVLDDDIIRGPVKALNLNRRENNQTYIRDATRNNTSSIALYNSEYH